MFKKFFETVMNTEPRPQTTWKPDAEPLLGKPMLEELRRAHLDGYYVPELETMYFKWDDFRYPRWFAHDMH